MKNSVAIILLVLGVFTGMSSAVEVTLFGPHQYIRTSGSPNVFTDTFPAYPGTGTLIVENGNQVDENRIIDAISSAEVFINGELIFGPKDFNKNAYLLKAPISLVENTSITVELRSTPGSYITVEIIEDVDPPTVTFNASPASMFVGDSSTLTWDTTNADSCVIQPGNLSESPSGSITVSPTETTTYTITATGLGGTATAQALITVESAVEPQPEGSFGEQYEDLIPSDATAEAYDPKRFSLITGLVQNLDDSPISDVVVGIHDHPDYGTTLTDAEGRFTIPVEGGGTITVVYEKAGLITAHRKVYVPWNDIAIAETIQMIAEDQAATTLTFDGNPDTVVTHRSTEVTDEFGSRSASMVFSGDNRAYLVDENGNDVQELTTVTTRATEFKTEQSMPAKLPPNSAYTYCVELSVDGAQRVRFEKPVITWVDNFLGFDVGMAVPFGYYDRDRGVWVPADNGVVVKLLDTDADGIVDALDADGDDLPNDLNRDGSFNDEVTGLDNPERYAPGSSFWRVAVTHFTPWDCNWPYGPPEDAIPPNPEEIPEQDEDEPDEPLPPPDDPLCLNSYVKQRSRVFHEDINIPGTDITLHYASNRVKGYRHVITVPASGEMITANLKRIIVKIQVAGRTFEQFLNPLPYQKATFIWDGLDSLGQPVTSPITAHVSIGFAYDAVYMSPGNFSRAFAQAGSDITGIRARREVISWKRNDEVIYQAKGKGQGVIAEGWTLSTHHHLSPVDPTKLHKGEGTTKSTSNGIVNTVAGTGGNMGYSGDGGPATEARITSPQSVAVDASGNLYISDTVNHRIRKVDPTGIITTIAGTGIAGYSGDGGPATQARISFPRGLAVDASGSLYIAESYNHCIRKVDPSGIITTVAGTGIGGYSGDGNPATQARISSPQSVAVDASGNLYIPDYANHRIRKVDSSSIITTVVGAGINGYSGDGGLSNLVQLSFPADVTVETSGNLYIADYLNHCIRKMGPPAAFISIAAAGDITSVEENGLGHIMSSAGLHKTTIDLDTGVTLYTFGYNEDNKIITFTDRFGDEAIIERDGNGVPTAITSPDGISTTLSVDANNHLTRITYPDGSYYDFEYSPDGLLTAKTEPEGNRFEQYFDSLGRLIDVLDEEGGYWHYTRTSSANGDILTKVTSGEGNFTTFLDHTYSTGAYTSIVTDPTGAETLFTRSADGLTVNSSLPCGMELAFKYDVDSEYKFKYVKEMSERTPSGLEKIALRDKTYQDTDADEVPDLITETVTVNNKSTTLVNNTLQAQKTATSHEGRTITTVYDPETLLTESGSVPGLHSTNYAYDIRGRLTSISTNTRQTTFAYNAQGFLESVTAPDNHTTTYSYDPVGRITGISRPDDGFVGFTYDKNGNMAVLTNPVDVDHGFGFNNVNRNSFYQTPLSRSYSYIYDKDRRLIQTNFPSGKTIINDYVDPTDPNDKSRIWQIRTPEGNIDFTYLCGTKVESITKGAESTTYGYDGKLVTSETISGTLSQSIGYSYNNDFDLTDSTYAGTTTSYAYDDDGLLTGAGNYTITRNAQNGLPESIAGGALSLSRTFNGYGEVESQNLTVNSLNVASWSLTRDNNGRITDKTETVAGAASNYVYTYDSMGRLLTVTKDSALVEEYQYDLNGTRTYEMNSLRGIAGRNFSYSDEDHLLSAGSVTYAYDLDGFLTTKTDGSEVTNYTYSFRGELLNVILPGGSVIDYLHDPLGRRIAKKVNGTIMEKYLWGGLTRLLAVYDGSDNLLMRFEYADGRMPVAMISGGSTYYLIYDQVGSLRIVADGAGNVIKSIQYDSFGNIIADSNPTLEVPFGFAGGLHDKDTGLVRFGYRDYDPDVGRWTAKDPIFFAGGDTDLYGYCLADPINFVDPKGLVKWGSVVKGGLAVVGGAISVGVGSAASTTVVGAIGGVPMVVGGSASIGWGVSKMITGFLDHDLALPKPSAAALATLVATGDVDKACKADFAEDIFTLGTGIGKMAGRMPSNFEIVGAGVDFVGLSAEGESLEDQFKK